MHSAIKDVSLQMPFRWQAGERLGVRSWLYLWAVVFLLCWSSSVSAKTHLHARSAAGKSVDFQLYSLMNINEIAMWVRGDGLIGNDPYSDSAGVWFPRGKGRIIFADGLLWSGQVYDGKIRGPRRDFWQFPFADLAGVAYSSTLRPGRIVAPGVAEDPEDPQVRIWRIRRDWQSADLRRDAAEFYGVPVDSVSEELVAELRQRYERDWQEWPWEKGAPFYDTNGNGVMDEGEKPGLLGADEVIWFVCNDLDSTRNFGLWDEPKRIPTGMELQVTVWAYRVQESFDLERAINRTVFKRYRLIYKGTKSTPDTAHIGEMFLSQFVDPDLGDLGDDLVGCDTIRQLGYAYNASEIDKEYHAVGLAPPSVGYSLIFGPVVPGGENDSAIVDFRYRRGRKNERLHSFAYTISGPAVEPFGWYDLYFVIRGLGRDGLPFTIPQYGRTLFWVLGDPLTGTGFLDQFPSDKRFYMSTGPFTMALGDTQEVVIALTAGLGSSALASFAVMRHFASYARLWARGLFTYQPPRSKPSVAKPPERFRLYQNVPNPFEQHTEISYDLAHRMPVRLEVYNVLGQKVRTLVDGEQSEGRYRAEWDGRDEFGHRVGPGIYFYRIAIGPAEKCMKMVKIR